MSNSIVKHIVVDIKKTIGDKILLLNMKPHFTFHDGIRGEQDGLTFTCVSETMGYNKFDAKIVGILKPPFEFDGTPTPVIFDGLEGKIWQDWSNKGAIKLSITAKSISPLENKRIKIGGNN